MLAARFFVKAVASRAMNPDNGQALNWFLIDREIPVSELVELAMAKWLAAQSFGSDQNYRRDLAILADQLLEDARKNA
jgi:hypothetical protein